MTPLLSQWTYQAMVHELIGIKNGRVDLSNVPGIKPELKVIFFSRERNRYWLHERQIPTEVLTTWVFHIGK